MDVIDLRSDTLTQPTDAMREAMAAAPVGDDVFGEDPTVKALEDDAAARMGMEAGLFVPSGTMANQLAILVHTQRQGQIIAEQNSHIALYEAGAASLLSGAQVRTVMAGNGWFGPTAVKPHIYPDDPHFAQTKAVCVENTHNWAGGTIWDADVLANLSGVVHANKAAMHMDGARIWNASVAAGMPPTAWTETMDSVMFCFSKGLSAPIGSMLCGSKEFIHEAHRFRKLLGGGMRQAGHMAAAAQVGLDTMVDRLADDHANAAALAQGLAGVEKLDVLGQPETNLVYVNIDRTGLNADDFMALMADVGILCLPRDAGDVIRFVTHRHVDRAQVDEAVRRIRAVLED